MNKIILPINHPNAKRMEFFLNKIEAPLTEIPFEKTIWKRSEMIRGGCRFLILPSKTTITLFFCDSYFDANDFGKANFFSGAPNTRWGVNGDVLYLVESEDTDKMDSLLGLFAGEE